MGGSISMGESNDELVDNLILSKNISKREVERVFRAVDRGCYFPDDVEVKDIAYRDAAWRSGTIHISAPCIYAEVLENLDLKPGLSFLNIGSGTGYLSTMVGLYLGTHGINIGIEMMPEVVEFAKRKVRSFLSQSDALNEFEFCTPEFVHGNGLLIPPGTRFDRIYCGAACSFAAQEYLQELLVIGGLLIVPITSKLLLIKRESEGEWSSINLMPVAFTSLLPATDPYLKVPDIPLQTAKPLEDLARSLVRRVLRKKIIQENPEIINENLMLASRTHLSKIFVRKHKGSDDGLDTDDDSDELERDIDDSDDDDNQSGPTKSYQRGRIKLDSGIVEDMYDSDSDMDHFENSDSDSESDRPTTSIIRSEPTGVKFGRLMEAKILALNLPKPVQQYLNLGRGFKV